MSQERISQIEKSSEEAYQLLGEYDRKIMLESDPRQRERYKDAKKEVQAQIDELGVELAKMTPAPVYNAPPPASRPSVSSNKMTIQERVKLRGFLISRFSSSELQAIAFDLGIDADSLPQETKDTFARELIAYCERRNTVIDLVELALNERPDAEITQLLQNLKSGDASQAHPNVPTPSANAGVQNSFSFNGPVNGQNQNFGGNQTVNQASNVTSPAASSQNTAPANPVKTQRPLSVFLCHSSGNKEQVLALYQRLQADGIIPWLDAEDLIAGQNFDLEIRKAVKKADIVVVCLSRASTSKEGYVQREIGFALDRAEEKPEGNIYLIPLKLEECDLPFRLSSYHGVKYYEERGYEHLLKALQLRASQLEIA